MNVFFLGTPEFSVPSLAALAECPQVKLAGVITTPDQPAGRQLKLKPSPVKEAALKLGIALHQPEKFNTEETIELLSSGGADLLVVVAYGKIIGERILGAYKDKIINLHPSLLPKYRGVAPYQWAILNGEIETGATIMYIDRQLDAGDIILQKKCDISEADNAQTLHDRLSIEGAGLLCDAVKLIAAGNAPRVPQDHASATYYKKIEKSMGKINWSKSALEIRNLIRGLYHWPSTFTTYNGDLIKIHEADIVKSFNSLGLTPGTIVSSDEKNGFVVSCGEGALNIKTLQLASRNIQNFVPFLRGYKIINGSMLN